MRGRGNEGLHGSQARGSRACRCVVVGAEGNNSTTGEFVLRPSAGDGRLSAVWEMWDSGACVSRVGEVKRATCVLAVGGATTRFAVAFNSWAVLIGL